MAIVPLVNIAFPTILHPSFNFLLMIIISPSSKHSNFPTKFNFIVSELINVTLQAIDKTLTENDLEEISKRIIETVSKKTGATIRS